MSLYRVIFTFLIIASGKASAHCLDESFLAIYNEDFITPLEHQSYGESGLIEYNFDKVRLIYKVDSIHNLKFAILPSDTPNKFLVYGSGSVSDSVLNDIGVDENNNYFSIFWAKEETKFICSDLSSLSEEIIIQSIDIALSAISMEAGSAEDYQPDETKYLYRDLAPVTSCWKDNVNFHLGHLADPISDNMRSFANGEVDVALLRNGSHSGPSHGLVIWHPPRHYEGEVSEFGIRECHVVQSFFGVDWEGLTATYDPELGLQLHTHVWITHEALYLYKKPLTISINQATGEVLTDVGETTDVLQWGWLPLEQ